MLRREGWEVNHKRLYRLYREENLQVRTRRRRKHVSRSRVALPQALASDVLRSQPPVRFLPRR